MDTFQVESFLAYMENDYDPIAEESIMDSLQQAKEKLSQIMDGLGNKFSELLGVLNNLKEAKLDKQQNDDMIEVLRVSQPRTDINFNAIRKQCFSVRTEKDATKQSQVFSVKTGGTPGKSHATSVEHEVEKSLIDTDESMKAAKRSDAYKRLRHGQYSGKEFETIPISKIAPDLQNSARQLNIFRKSYKALQNELTRLRKEDAPKVARKIELFFKKVIEYFSFRISILQTYISRAKLSVKGVKDNIVRSSKDDKPVQTLGDTKRKGIGIQVNMKSISEAEEIKKLHAEACKVQTYEEYKPIYEKLTRLLHCEGKNIEALKVVGTVVNVVTAGDSTPEVVDLNGKQLYHSSTDPNLKVLSGRFRDAQNTLFPEPRVYMHVNFSTDRFGAKNSSEHNVYVPVKKIEKAYRDPEMGRTAVYVISHGDIPMKKVDFEKIKENKLKKIDQEDQKEQEKEGDSE